MTPVFEILDVGHGSCAYFAATNGNVLLFDCGHNSDPEFRPSTYFGGMRWSGIERLFISNYDEDHISDLPGLRKSFKIDSLVRNKSITPDQLRLLKEEVGPVTEAMESLLDMMTSYNSPIVNGPEFPGLQWSVFHNQYKTDFEDTNNLSLVTFVKFGQEKVVLPGDLEKPGWQKLLTRQDFRNELRDVTIFIASHHGRESGYCPEVFQYCNPDVIVFSDAEINYETQEMSGVYCQLAKGVQFNGECRRVLTTRNDGRLKWTLNGS